MVVIRAAMVAAMISTVRVASDEAGDAEKPRRQSIQSLACNDVTRERRRVALSIGVCTMWARSMGPFGNRVRGVCRAGRARLGDVADVQLWHPRPTLHVSPRRLALALRATEEPITVAVPDEAVRRFNRPTENSTIWKWSDVAAIMRRGTKNTRLPIIKKITEEFRR